MYSTSHTRFHIYRLCLPSCHTYPYDAADATAIATSQCWLDIANTVRLYQAHSTKKRMISDPNSINTEMKKNKEKKTNKRIRSCLMHITKPKTNDRVSERERESKCPKDEP